MKITHVVAMADNRVIGRDNAIPWHLPDDMKHFRDVTVARPIIMGRKTFESIGRALPDRRNIVISRQEDYEALGCDVVHSLEEAIELAEKDGTEEIVIIGGAQIYENSLSLADRLYLTIVHGDFDGDAYYPEILEERWREVDREEHPADDKHAYAFTFVTYDRRS